LLLDNEEDKDEIAPLVYDIEEIECNMSDIDELDKKGRKAADY
jgi:hypothetical protein